MFQNLEPNTNYSVTLTMRNGDGEGPATSVFLKTLVEPEGIFNSLKKIYSKPIMIVLKNCGKCYLAANSSEKPSLLITSEYTVIRQSADVLIDAALLYRSTEQIRDTALLTSSSQFFVSDSAERLYRVSFNGTTSNSQLLLEPNSTDLRPWSLSADWLNSKLYIAVTDDDTGFWRIARCENLECKDLKIVIAGLGGEPTRLQVDPYNGYLFWMTGDGIYRVDLDKLESEGAQVRGLFERLVKIVMENVFCLQRDFWFFLAATNFEEIESGRFYRRLQQQALAAGVSVGEHDQVRLVGRQSRDRYQTQHETAKI